MAEEISQARPYIGGQAVLEGVMMRSPASFAIVVRRKDGSLHVRERPISDPRKGAATWPFVRGIASLVESLKLGGEALRFSAEQLEKDLEAEEASAATKAAARITPGTNVLSSIAGMLTSLITGLGMSLFTLTTSDAESSGPREATDSKSKGPMGLMLIVMIVFLIALPQVLAGGANRIFHFGFDVQSPQFQVLTGVFKLSIVIGYLTLIRRLPDIRRVFQYHGAEHKTISTYEGREELTVANARRKTTLHPRCGTTFLVMVALVSIVVFTAVGGFLPRINTNSEIVKNVVFFLEKLPFLPLIASITFEIQRLFARYCTTGPLRALLWPGFLVQKVTTIEPNDDQLEVALASLKATLFRERGETPEVADDVRFANYAELVSAERLRSQAA